MKLPDFRSYVAIRHAHIRSPKGPIAISSHDKLLWNYPGAIGIKNGYTVKDRATFVGAATRGGHTLVVTLMRANPRYWPEAAALLDWGFAAKQAGSEPVGQLVDPVDTPQPDRTPTSTDVQPAAARVSTGSGDGLPVLPASMIGAGLVVMAVGLGRTRRRGRRKLSLPPL
jgi:D-alanyl-D-alanine carboxypeptidase (penicillin-binding protein 5/6)